MGKKFMTRNEAWLESKRRRSAKIVAPASEPEPPEHPEDKAFREEAIERAKRLASLFWTRENIERVQALVTTYCDADAENALRDMREKFWTMEEPKESPNAK